MNGRRMDAEGGRVVHPERRARKLAVVVAVQNVLVAACLLVTLYVCWSVQSLEQGSGDNVHIHFDPIAGSSGPQTLSFRNIKSKHKMSLIDDKTIQINCTGPYILHMNVCCDSLDQKETTGSLKLQVADKQTPLVSVPLNISHKDCRGLHSIVYLRASQQASLHLDAKEDFMIERVTVGLDYLLGSRCVF